jgi:hypothetical protein
LQEEEKAASLGDERAVAIGAPPADSVKAVKPVDPGDRYERIGAGYAATRRTDPRIAARVHAALGGARTVVNVGAGGGG